MATVHTATAPVVLLHLLLLPQAPESQDLLGNTLHGLGNSCASKHIEFKRLEEIVEHGVLPIAVLLFVAACR